MYLSGSLERESIQPVPKGGSIRELLGTPCQATLQFSQLIVPPGTGAAGSVKVEAQCKVPFESC